MKQIASFSIHNLRNEEDFGFQKRVEAAALAMLDQKSDKAMVDAYVAALAQFDAALKQSQKNSQTEADAAFDALYTNAYALARILPDHPTVFTPWLEALNLACARF